MPGSAQLSGNHGAAASDTSDSLPSSLQRAIALVDNHASGSTERGISAQIADILMSLVNAENQAQNPDQKSTLEALIDFLSSDLIDSLETYKLDLDKWRRIRQLLEAAWPELINVGSFERSPSLPA